MTNPAVESARSQALGDLLRRTARRTPDKLALVDREIRWTFSELDRRVNATANALQAQGVDGGDRIALLSHNRAEFVVLAYASARLGTVLVPINFMLSAGEVAYILDHAQANAFVVEDVLLDTACEALSQVSLSLRTCGVIGISSRAGWDNVGEWLAHPDDREPVSHVADDQPVRLMYTSGTESRPKGALLSSRSLIAQYVSCIVDGGMEADDIDVHALPMYHCAQLDCFLGPDIYLGATSIVLPSPEPVAVLRTIEKERATKFFAPPTVWISLLRSPEFDLVDLSSLRKGYYGASAMPVEVLRELQMRLPDVRLWNFYGQTELAPVATILGPDEQVTRAGSAGRPVLNVETRLVDEAGNEVPNGAVGEIVHRSPQATLGYFRDDEKTANAFSGGWFHSGDLGVMTADGYLSVVDRKKDMIKTGGENVASREIEETIFALDSVAEVAVFGVPDPRWVEAVIAAVVPRPGVNLSADEVIAHCRRSLARFKTPKRVVILDQLPKNPSGKILKRDLRNRYAEVNAKPASPVVS